MRLRRYDGTVRWDYVWNSAAVTFVLLVLATMFGVMFTGLRDQIARNTEERNTKYDHMHECIKKDSEDRCLALWRWR